MTNPTNIFNFVPHDVLQHVVSPFLNSGDRANFNAVLEPTERVHKKFPKNFPLKFAVKIALLTQRCHMARINYMVDNGDNIGAGSVRVAVRWIGLYADFLVKPMTLPLFKHSSNGLSKKKALSDLSIMISDDFVFVDFMTDEVKQKIRRAMSVIQAIEPIGKCPCGTC